MDRDAPRGECSISPRRISFSLSFCLLFLAGEVHFAQAGHPVLIGAKESTESAILAEITAELVRSGLDVPYIVPHLKDARAAWEALQDGEVDVYPESIRILTSEVLHDPGLHTKDQLRSALVKHQVRMTDSVGFGDTVLLFRADLPYRAPASAVVLLKMQGLITPKEMRRMTGRSREDRVPESTIAADFLQEKFPEPAVRRSNVRPLFLGAAMLLSALAIVALRRGLPRLRQAWPKLFLRRFG